MSLERSAWRISDAGRFGVAQDKVRTATATLFELADQGALELSDAVAEAHDIRLELLSVDGFNRQAIDSFIARLDERLAELVAAQR
jgi:hypothetical protein